MDLENVGWALVGALIVGLLYLLWAWVKGRQGWLWMQRSSPELRRAQHLARHVHLHQALDELVADLISHTTNVPSKTTVLELILWSWAQCGHPDEEAEGGG